MNSVFFRSTIALVLTLSWLASMRAETVLSSDLQEAVKDLADGTFPRLASESVKDAPVERLIRVIAGMGRPPISKRDFETYQDELAGLTDAQGEVADLALYLRARLFQVHRIPRDDAKAEALYLELGARSPSSHWAQLGLVKLGLMGLYRSQNFGEGEERFKRAEALLTMLTEPALKRDLHLQIGWAGLYFDWPLSEVIPHLKAADEVGGLMGMIPEDLVLQIAELSFRNGETAQARVYFERFLREFPTSDKRFNVEQRLVDVADEVALKDGMLP